MSPIEFKTVKASVVQMPDGSTTIGIYSTPSVKSTVTTPERTSGLHVSSKAAQPQSPLRSDVLTNRQLLFAPPAATAEQEQTTLARSCISEHEPEAVASQRSALSMIWRDLSPHTHDATTAAQVLLHPPARAVLARASASANLMHAHCGAPAGPVSSADHGSATSRQGNTLHDNAMYGRSMLSTVSTNSGQKHSESESATHKHNDGSSASGDTSASDQVCVPLTAATGQPDAGGW